MLKVVMYVHKNSQTIVSKHCPDCGEIKLTADFAEHGLKNMLTAECQVCRDSKQEGELELETTTISD